MLPINISRTFSKLDYAIIVVWIVIGGLSIFLESYVPVILLFSIFPIYLFFANPFIFYCLLFFFIPISTELELGSLGTDFPTEPIMWLMLGFASLWALKNHSKLNTNYVRHPMTLLVLIHLTWILITCFFFNCTHTFPKISNRQDLVYSGILVASLAFYSEPQNPKDTHPPLFFEPYVFTHHRINPTWCTGL